MYPRVKIVTSAVDDVHSEDRHCLVPGIGSFGDRFFGTDIYSPTTVASRLEHYLQEENEPVSSESCADDVEDYSTELQ